MKNILITLFFIAMSCNIASAQWTFNQIGRLNRIDLRLKPGIDVDAFRRALGEKLPLGVVAIAPQIERDRAVINLRSISGSEYL